MKPKEVLVRRGTASDVDAIVELSLLAWEPIFESFEKTLGPAIYRILWPDWKKSQAEGVAGACRATDKYTTLVAERDGQVVGFVVYELKGERGEVVLLAVHPEFQRRGIATKLNQVALEAMKAAGAKLAIVETGGDDGHAPARRAYEKVGYTGLPIVRYFKAL